MNKLIVALMVVAATLVGYFYGAMEPMIVHEPIMGYKERTCDRIQRYEDGTSVCMVMNYDDSDIKILESDVSTQAAMVRLEQESIKVSEEL